MGGENFDDSDFRVLLVEDNDGDVVLFKEALSQLNRNVALKIVKDSNAAIQFLENSTATDLLPHFILTDINMPGMSGKDLLILLKTEKKWNYIPVIMMSTTSDPVEIKKSYELGAAYFAVKRDRVDQIVSLFQKIFKLIKEPQGPRSLSDFVL